MKQHVITAKTCIHNLDILKQLSTLAINANKSLYFTNTNISYYLKSQQDQIVSCLNMSSTVNIGQQEIAIYTLQYHKITFLSLDYYTSFNIAWGSSRLYTLH